MTGHHTIYSLLWQHQRHQGSTDCRRLGFLLEASDQRFHAAASHSAMFIPAVLRAATHKLHQTSELGLVRRCLHAGLPHPGAVAQRGAAGGRAGLPMRRRSSGPRLPPEPVMSGGLSSSRRCSCRCRGAVMDHRLRLSHPFTHCCAWHRLQASSLSSPRSRDADTPDTWQDVRHEQRRENAPPLFRYKPQSVSHSSSIDVGEEGSIGGLMCNCLYMRYIVGWT